jgi:hypothetical protein
MRRFESKCLHVSNNHILKVNIQNLNGLTPEERERKRKREKEKEKRKRDKSKGGIHPLY